MTSQEQLRNLIGTTAYDRDGDKLGKIGQVYCDDDTNEPKWVTVNTGFFGTNENFVPVQGADFSGENVTLSYDKATVKDAPNISEDGHLSPEDEERLYKHYGLDYGTARTLGQDAGYETGRATDRETGRDTDRDRDRDRDRDTTGYTEGHDTSGANTDNAMTRSEERLVAGTRTEEAGRARLRKHVVTERQTVEVPVSHEELTVTREPITDSNRGEAYSGGDITEEEHEVTLRAERPVVDTEVEAVERVKIGTETVRDTETVDGEVRREEIEIDDPNGTDRRR